MQKAVLLLLAVATALLANGENEELKAGIEALEALGEEAKHTSSEYKALKKIVDTIDENAISDAKAEAKAKEDAEAKEEKIDYAGIKMIGSTWHHISDNYKEAYATADECAEANKKA